jgi:hypothetical protein
MIGTKPGAPAVRKGRRTESPGSLTGWVEKVGVDVRNRAEPEASERSWDQA